MTRALWINADMMMTVSVVGEMISRLPAIEYTCHSSLGTQGLTPRYTQARTTTALNAVVVGSLYPHLQISSHADDMQTMQMMCVDAVCRLFINRADADTFGLKCVVYLAFLIKTSSLFPYRTNNGTSSHEGKVTIECVKYAVNACVSLPRHTLTIVSYRCRLQMELNLHSFKQTDDILCSLYISLHRAICNPITNSTIQGVCIVMPFNPIASRSSEIQHLITQLVANSPYPLHWYEQKTDAQVKAMARRNPSIAQYYASLVENAMAADEAAVQARLMEMRGPAIMLDPTPEVIQPIESKKNIIGHYEVTVSNRRSLRFKFVRPDGTTTNGIISKLRLSGYRLENGVDDLPKHSLCLVWESGKILILPVGTIVGKILGSAIENPKHLVQEIYRVSSSQTKQAN